MISKVPPFAGDLPTELHLLLIISQEPDFLNTLIPTVMKLKVSSLGFLILIYGIKTLQNKISIFTYKSAIFGLGGGSSPINSPVILQNNPSFYMLKITLYDIFFVLGHQIPSYYVQGILWTKLAPAWPLPGVYILHWGQLDKMQQLLSTMKCFVFFLNISIVG